MNYASVLERFLCLRDLSLDFRKLSDLGSNLPYESWPLQRLIPHYTCLSVYLPGRKGSRADEEEPDLGVSYEVLPAGAGELPEVRNLCFKNSKE